MLSDYQKIILNEIGVQRWVERPQVTKPVVMALNCQTPWLAVVELAPEAEKQAEERALLDAILAAAKLSKIDKDVTALINEATDLLSLAEALDAPVILCFGQRATTGVLGQTMTLKQNRQKVHYAPNCHTPVILTHALSTLLREPALKRETWNDVKFAKRLELGASTKD